jgi:hypothetical protein
VLGLAIAVRVPSRREVMWSGSVASSLVAMCWASVCVPQLRPEGRSSARTSLAEVRDGSHVRMSPRRLKGSETGCLVGADAQLAGLPRAVRDGWLRLAIPCDTRANHDRAMSESESS